jgi:hypothetical protein
MLARQATASPRYSTSVGRICVGKRGVARGPSPATPRIEPSIAIVCAATGGALGVRGLPEQPRTAKSRARSARLGHREWVAHA